MGLKENPGLLSGAFHITVSIAVTDHSVGFHKLLKYWSVNFSVLQRNGFAVAVE